MIGSDHIETAGGHALLEFLADKVGEVVEGGLCLNILLGHEPLHEGLVTVSVTWQGQQKVAFHVLVV